MLTRDRYYFLLFLLLAFVYSGSAYAVDRSRHALGWPGNTLNGLPCRGKASSYGPFDYTNPAHRGKQLKVVNDYHFTPEIEQLIRGKGSDIMADLDYVLRAFPNHHRALYSTMNYLLRHNQSANSNWPPMECYLQRAAVFSPRDANVHLIFGIFYQRKGLLGKALEEYTLADKLKPNSANIHYNLGLLLIEMDKPEAALQHARKAYKLGYPLPGLKNKLKSSGVWKE